MLTKDQIEELMLDAGLAVDLESPVPSAQTFADLGLDSLDVYNVLVEIETKTGIHVPDEDFENVQSIDALHAYIAARAT